MAKKKKVDRVSEGGSVKGSAQPPVIFVPGITATNLRDYYPLPPEKVWSAVLNKKYERISLHPDDTRYEAMEPARVGPYSVFGLIYEDLIEALRHDLSPTPDKPTPVFGFAYDWRHDCTFSADALREFVDEVLARTVLLPHYRDEELRVDLVGHSMGGLIIADYLRRYGDDKNVNRVVTIGSPFRGSLDAIMKLTSGMGALTGENPRDRERETARTLPAIYQLLPSFEGAVKPGDKAPEGLPTDVFQAETWQPSLLESLTRYIDLHQARIGAKELFQMYLDKARSHRDRLEELSLEGVLPEGKDGWLPIVGVGSKTQVCVEIEIWNNQPWFDIDPEDSADKWPGSELTGDGTVPFLGACPGFLERERLVCVSPDDFSMWEFKDKVLAKTAGFHAALPAVNLVQRLTLRFLRREYSGDVWGWAPPGVDATQWPRWIKNGK